MLDRPHLHSVNGVVDKTIHIFLCILCPLNAFRFDTACVNEAAVFSFWAKMTLLADRGRGSDH